MHIISGLYVLRALLVLTDLPQKYQVYTKAFYHLPGEGL